MASDAATIFDPYIPADPETDLSNLQQILLARQAPFQRLEGYYIGEHGHSFGSQNFQAAFGRQMRQFRDNWMRLVVESTVNRLSVQGFRVGDDATDASERAWEIWRSNRLPSESMKAHREAMKLGLCYLLVDPFSKSPDGQAPSVTVQSPMNVYALPDPNNRFRMVQAIKRWIGAADGKVYANLYFEDRVLNYRSTSETVTADLLGTPLNITFEQIGEVDNPLGVVPVIPLENQPTLIAGGVSDLEDLIPLNDALNKEFRDMMIASEYQAFRQKWITGVEIPKDPVSGTPIPSAVLEASISRVWNFENPDVKVGDFAQIDLQGYTEIIDMCIHHIAMVSNTPAYHLIGKMANMSADAIRAAELGFVDKCRTKQVDYGASWETAMSLALIVDEESSDSYQAVESLWKPPEASSDTELANAASQLNAVGLPFPAILERLNYSPPEIERILALKAAEPPAPVVPGAAAPNDFAALDAVKQSPDGGDTAQDD